MNFRMPMYEVRLHGKENWEDISEINLIQMLHDVYGRVTPLIQQLFQGEQVQTPDAIFRLKGQLW